MKFRFNSATVLMIIITNNILVEIYQSGGYYLYLDWSFNAEYYQKVPKNIELMVKPILNQFILSDVSVPKYIRYTETQSKQIDLLFNIFRSL